MHKANSSLSIRANASSGVWHCDVWNDNNVGTKLLYALDNVVCILWIDSSISLQWFAALSNRLFPCHGGLHESIVILLVDIAK